MRVAFMGTPAFAVPCLDALHAGHDVVAVYCRPDRGAGRGRKITDSPVKTRALELDLPVYQPEAFDEVAVAELRSLSPDVVCVAAYGAILPTDALDVAPHGAINVHASLLPRHRGAAPVERAILDGDAQTGVSIMLMEETLDTGPVAHQVRVEVGTHTAASLAATLSIVGAEALTHVLTSVADGTVEWRPQDDDEVTYAGKVFASDVAVVPEMTVEGALRRIRASSRRAATRIGLCGSLVTILAATPSSVVLEPGTVSTDKGLHLGLSDGSIRIEVLKPENRKEMSGDAFVCGLQATQAFTWEGAA